MLMNYRSPRERSLKSLTGRASGGKRSNLMEQKEVSHTFVFQTDTRLLTTFLQLLRPTTSNSCKCFAIYFLFVPSCFTLMTYVMDYMASDDDNVF